MTVVVGAAGSASVAAASVFARSLWIIHDEKKSTRDLTSRIITVASVVSFACLLLWKSLLPFGCSILEPISSSESFLELSTCMCRRRRCYTALGYKEAARESARVLDLPAVEF